MRRRCSKHCSYYSIKDRVLLALEKGLLHHVVKFLFRLVINRSNSSAKWFSCSPTSSTLGANADIINESFYLTFNLQVLVQWNFISIELSFSSKSPKMSLMSLSMLVKHRTRIMDQENAMERRRVGFGWCPCGGSSGVLKNVHLAQIRRNMKMRSRVAWDIEWTPLRSESVDREGNNFKVQTYYSSCTSNSRMYPSLINIMRRPLE